MRVQGRCQPLQPFRAPATVSRHRRLEGISPGTSEACILLAIQYSATASPSSVGTEPTSITVRALLDLNQKLQTGEPNEVGR